MKTPDHSDHSAKGIMCSHILEGARKVNLICHAPDGSWDFICGEDSEDHEDVEKLHLICANCAFSDFVDGLTQEDIPVGFEASRPDPSRRWVINPLSEEDLAEYGAEGGSFQ